MFNVSGEGMTTKNMQGMVTKMGAKEQPHKNKLENNQSIKFNCFTLLQTARHVKATGSTCPHKAPTVAPNSAALTNSAMAKVGSCKAFRVAALGSFHAKIWRKMFNEGFVSNFA